MWTTAYRLEEHRMREFWDLLEREQQRAAEDRAKKEQVVRASLEPPLARSREIDNLDLALIPTQLVKREPELSRATWFDYRFVHPVHRTRLFAYHWRIAYQQKFREYFDRDQSHLKL